MIIVLNNKSNLNKDQFENYQERLKTISTNHNIILCPSSCFLPLVKLDNIQLGSQDCSRENEGAHTGEIAASQLRSLNIKYCIVGHSERRIEKKETKQDILEKIKKLLENNITPIYCIGETIDQKNNNQTNKIIEESLKYIIENIDNNYLEKIIIAYEPIWAVGTGAIPKKNELENIIKRVKELCPKNIVLYGGSINETNIDIIKEIKQIDGYLIGGLSLKVDILKKIINKI